MLNVENVFTDKWYSAEAFNKRIENTWSVICKNAGVTEGPDTENLLSALQSMVSGMTQTEQMELTTPYSAFLSENGIVIPNIVSTKEIVTAAIKNAFGEDIDTTSTSHIGRLIEQLALIMFSSVGFAASVAIQMNPYVASGVFLDALASLYFCTRKTGSKAAISAKIYPLTKVQIGKFLDGDVRLQTEVEIKAKLTEIAFTDSALNRWVAYNEDGEISVAVDTTEQEIVFQTDRYVDVDDEQIVRGRDYFPGVFELGEDIALTQPGKKEVYGICSLKITKVSKSGATIDSDTEIKFTDGGGYEWTAGIAGAKGIDLMQVGESKTVSFTQVTAADTAAAGTTFTVQTFGDLPLENSGSARVTTQGVAGVYAQGKTTIKIAETMLATDTWKKTVVSGTLTADNTIISIVDDDAVVLTVPAGLIGFTDDNGNEWKTQTEVKVDSSVRSESTTLDVILVAENDGDLSVESVASYELPVFVGMSEDLGDIISQGAAVESDEAFRLRFTESRSPSTGYLDSLKTALNKVDGLYEAYIKENNTSAEIPVEGSTDVIAAHSICAVVDYDGTEATSAEIARAIFDHKSAGCAYTKLTNLGLVETVRITDDSFGLAYDVVFNHVQRVDFGVEITVEENKYSGGDLESDVITAIRDWASGKVNGVDGVMIGTAVNAFEIAAGVSATLPEIKVGDVKVFTIVSGTEGEHVTQLTMKFYQKANLIPAKISVRVE